VMEFLGITPIAGGCLCYITIQWQEDWTWALPDVHTSSTIASSTSSSYWQATNSCAAIREEIVWR
jgi:hypothetical protein